MFQTRQMNEPCGGQMDQGLILYPLTALPVAPEYIASNPLAAATASALSGYPNEPRTYGVTVRARF